MAENAIPDKMAFPARPDGGRHWVPDERDGFISWLRGEFAAANAIIDSLCHHLRTTGEPGEYDLVIASIQQRRYNWTPVLHMQQYFSVAEVVMSLQQAAWGRQQQQQQRALSDHHQHHHHHQPKPSPKDFRRGYFAHRHAGGRFENGTREAYAPAAERPRAEKARGSTPVENEGGDDTSCSKLDYSPKDDGKIQNSEQSTVQSILSEGEKEIKNTAAPLEGPAAITKQEQAEDSSPVPKLFLCNETCDGKMVNVFEGLKLYDDLLDNSEVAKIISLANSLRLSGKNGDLQGQTFVTSRKPSKGHGRETIQLGTCIYEGPIEDENFAGSHRERKVESIPTLLQDVFDRLIQQQVIVTKPDYCVIDFFNEGEHSQPHTWLLRYGRPLFHLLLTDCDMVFGRTFTLETRGDYRGSLRLSVKAGSLLVLQDRSADMVKRAIPSIRKQRIILTFGKSQFRDNQLSNGLNQNSPISPGLPWGQHTSRSTNVNRRPSGSKNYGVVSGSGVLQAPHVRAQQTCTPNGIQPLFVAQTPVAMNAVPYAPVSPVPISAGWTVTTPRKPDVPRLPVPGTGVFFPPTGSGHSPPPSASPESPSRASNSPSEKMQCATTDNEHTGKSNPSSEASLMENPVGSSTQPPCNGDTSNYNVGGTAENKDHFLDTKEQVSEQATCDAISAKQ